jgi:hypothetical protein
LPPDVRTGEEALTHERNIASCVVARREALDACLARYPELNSAWEQVKAEEDAAKWEAHNQAIEALNAESNVD